MRNLRWFVAGLLVAAGCGDDGSGTTQDAAGSDGGGGSDSGNLPDAAVTGCTSFATIGSTFTNTICGPWGAASGTADVSNPGATILRITTQTSSASNGGCTSNATVALPDGGIFFQAVSPILTSDGHLALQLAELDVEIRSSDNKLRMTRAMGLNEIAAQTFNATTMKWWRLRPDRTANEIVAEYSADANAWFELGRAARTLSTMTHVAIEAGAMGTSASAAVADVDNLATCP